MSDYPRTGISEEQQSGTLPAIRGAYRFWAVNSIVRAERKFAIQLARSTSLVLLLHVRL